MATHEIFVENIKCGGCINRIKTALLKLSGVIAVEILKDEGKVCISGIAVEKERVLAKLSSLGYPQKGNNTLMNKAKSLVSCAAGRYEKIKYYNYETENIEQLEFYAVLKAGVRNCCYCTINIGRQLGNWNFRLTDYWHACIKYGLLWNRWLYYTW
jgi:copper chaperone